MAIQAEEIVEEKEVAEFLKAKSAEEEYRLTTEIVNDCFPERLECRVFFRPDPEIVDDGRVVFQITLPESFSFVELDERRRSYHAERVRRLFGAVFPVCCLSIKFS